MKLKVYGGLKFIGRRQVRCVVAAPNQKVAAAAAHETLHGFRQYWGETGNAKELKEALAQPGVLLYCDSPKDYYTDGYPWIPFYAALGGKDDEDKEAPAAATSG